MTNLSRREYNAFLRADLYTFFQRSFYELYPNTRFLSNWHHHVLAHKLEQARRGKITRLIINLPPRHLKSLFASVVLPAFWLGHNPSAQIICASYGLELSEKLARDTRVLMSADFYKEAFPKTRLIQTSLEELATDRNGGRLARSVGGGMIGRGADVIIIDDALKPDEALSDVQRKAVNEWFSNSVVSRLNNKDEGCIIVIQQRLHEDDLPGHLLGQKGWEVLCLPSIAEDIQEFAIDTIFGPVRYRREIDDVLHPARESREALEQLSRTMGEYNFAGQYQQRPAPAGGGLVKAEWFGRFDRNNPPVFERIIQSWDTANKPDESNDFSVCTTWGVKDNRSYLLHVLRRRLNFPDLKRSVLEMKATYNPSVVLVEDKSSGTALIQDLREARIPVAGCIPKEDKRQRMSVQSIQIESGFVFLPNEAHWLDAYLHELTTFPNGRFDDQADSTSQFLGWLKTRFPGQNVLDYYINEAEKLNRAAPDIRYTLQRPPGQDCSTVYTISGQQITLGDNGLLHVGPDDAIPLMQAGWTQVGDQYDPGFT